MNFIEETKTYVHKNIKVLSDEQVVRTCLDFNFDATKINQYLKTYETEERYKGMEEYEWNTIQSRKDKEDERLREQARKERERLRREEAKIRAERKAEAEVKRQEREARYKERVAKKELAQAAADEKAAANTPGAEVVEENNVATEAH